MMMKISVLSTKAPPFPRNLAISSQSQYLELVDGYQVPLSLVRGLGAPSEPGLTPF